MKNLKFKYRKQEYEIVPITPRKFFILGWKHAITEHAYSHHFAASTWIIICVYSETYDVWFEEFVNLEYLDTFNQIFYVDVLTMNETYSYEMGHITDRVTGMTKKAVNIYLKYLDNLPEK